MCLVVFFSFKMFNIHESVCKTNLSISEFCKLLCETSYTKQNIFLHMNVRSLNKNINKIDELLGLLPCSPEVMVISETKLKNIILHLLKIIIFIHQILQQTVEVLAYI